MEPENTTQVGVNKKMILGLTLLGVMVIFGVVAMFYSSENTPNQNTEVKTVPMERKAYTQAEKEQILARLVASVPKDTTSQAEKERLLRNLAKKVPQDTVSNEEKLRLLRALEASVKQIN